MYSDSEELNRRWRDQILRGLEKDFGLVPSCCQEPAVTHPAEKAPNNPCLVVVVHGEPLSPSSSADSALPALRLKQPVVLAGFKSVGVLDSELMGRLGASLLPTVRTELASWCEEPESPVL